MTATTWPPFLTWCGDWVEANPALGAIFVLALIAVLLWLLRKSLKLFTAIILFGVVAILASYFLQGSEITNKVVRDGAGQAIEQGKNLIESGKEAAKEALEKQKSEADE